MISHDNHWLLPALLDLPGNLLVLQDGVFDAPILPVDSAMHVNDLAQDIRKLSWPM